jgi:hypothetical protein
VGCAKRHCTTRENDGAGLPGPEIPGSTQLPAQVTEWTDVTGGAGDADGCSGNGSIIVCKGKSTPRLIAYDATSIGNMQRLWTSCSDPTKALNPGDHCDPANYPDRLTTLLDTALVGYDLNGFSSVIVADKSNITRFEEYGYTQWQTALPTGASGLYPTGSIITSNGMVTLLMKSTGSNGGPILTFNPANGNQVGSILYPGLTTDGDGNTRSWVTNGNSACAIGNRIYAAMNQWTATYGYPDNTDQVVGRLYAIDVGTASDTNPGPSVGWNGNYYSFTGPTDASPMCTPSDYVAYFDYGGQVEDSNSYNYNAGVLAVADCTPPNVASDAACNVPSPPNYTVRYTYSLASITGHSGIQAFVNANFAWDPTDSCFWVEVTGAASGNGLGQTYCITATASPIIVKIIDVAALPGAPATGMWQSSDITLAQLPASSGGEYVAIFGSRNAGCGSCTVTEAVLAVDTGACQTPPCTTDNTGLGSGWASGHPGRLYWYDIGDSPSTSLPAAANGQFPILNTCPAIVAFTDENSYSHFASYANDACN